MSARMIWTKCELSPELAALLEKAKHHVMTPAERREQAISWVYGQLWDSQRTKDEIEQSLVEQGLIAPRDAP